MGFFGKDRLAKATVGSLRTYLTEGTYLLKLIDASQKLTRDTKQECVITEYEIVEANPSDPDSPLKAGTKVSWVCVCREEAMFQTDMLCWVSALCGMDPRADKDQIMGEFLAASSELIEDITTKGAMRGALIRVQCQTKLTKKNKTPFTQHLWSPAERGKIGTEVAA